MPLSLCLLPWGQQHHFDGRGPVDLEGEQPTLQLMSIFMKALGYSPSLSRAKLAVGPHSSLFHAIWQGRAEQGRGKRLCHSLQAGQGQAVQGQGKRLCHSLQAGQGWAGQGRGGSSAGVIACRQGRAGQVRARATACAIACRQGRAGQGRAGLGRVKHLCHSMQAGQGPAGVGRARAYRYETGFSILLQGMLVQAPLAQQIHDLAFLLTTHA